MASKRLTKAVKEEIVKAVIKKTFAEKDKDHKEKEFDLADLMYRSRYSEKDIAFMKSAPDGAFLYSGLIRVEKIGVTYWREFRFREARRVFHRTNLENHMVSSDTWEALKQAVVDLDKARDLIEEQKKALRRTTNAILNSVTTEKRLIEVWPEVLQYCAFTEETVNLPAVISGDLNDMIVRFSKK